MTALPPHWDTLEEPKIYLRTLMTKGFGLPCYMPSPQEPHAGGELSAVAPGDVGYFSPIDGFTKAFNIWDDDAAIQRTATSMSPEIIYHTPAKTLKVRRGFFSHGKMITGGGPVGEAIHQPGKKYVDSADLSGSCYSARTTVFLHRAYARFEIHCESDIGAALVITSSADLHSVRGGTQTLREHIIKYAEVLYRHYEAMESVDTREPLYIVSACTMSEECGIAAYNCPMPLGRNTLRLVDTSINHDGHSSEDPLWDWTTIGTSTASFYQTPCPGSKDLCLFLQGFKLDFSSEFRARVKNEPARSADGPPSAEGGGGAGGHGSEGGKGGASDESNTGGSGGGPTPGLGGNGQGTSEWTTHSGGAPGQQGYALGVDRALESESISCSEGDTFLTRACNHKGSSPPRDSDSTRTDLSGKIQEGIFMETFPNNSRENVRPIYCLGWNDTTQHPAQSMHPCDIINEFLLRTVGQYP